MRMRGGHFWQFGSIASVATETTILVVSFCPKHDLRSDLKVPNSKNFSGGACPQTPPTLFTLTHTQWPYQSKKKLPPALQSQIKVLKVQFPVVRKPSWCFLLLTKFTTHIMSIENSVKLDCGTSLYGCCCPNDVHCWKNPITQNTTLG